MRPATKWDRVLHGHAVPGELLGQLLERVLGAGHGEAIAGHDEDRLGLPIRKAASSAEPDFTLRWA